MTIACPKIRADRVLAKSLLANHLQGNIGKQIVQMHALFSYAMQLYTHVYLCIHTAVDVDEMLKCTPDKSQLF